MKFQQESQVPGGGLPKSNPAIGALFCFCRNAGHAGGAGRAVRLGFMRPFGSIFSGKGRKNLLGGGKIGSRDRENQQGSSASGNRLDHGGDTGGFESLGKSSNLGGAPFADRNPVLRLKFLVQESLISFSPVFPAMKGSVDPCPQPWESREFWEYRQNGRPA